MNVIITLIRTIFVLTYNNSTIKLKICEKRAEIKIFLKKLQKIKMIKDQSVCY